ncbi:hypothetical protein BCR33DRAFT_721404 [Rhizoclosmatium globosum]|uniref:Trichohyalin-plectin-homology domain-containing protein n=1 Tax=Rhizoclosmatium globosum TaxID=329046 RepID=A0A1Y2BSG1_9FUNG|nr:hypothetical protein BCR33DRAFT_721404 [Rhizoclosmatium globosum]|eukprot:ORY37688.1 hypothetical protein BCR33DRAFT_721404 [Rhizoclosmatium globosum]
MMVLSAIELKQLTQRITSSEPDKTIQDLLNKDREDRYQLSRARVQNWENTVLGQRRKRLEARNERLNEEELQRQEIDRRNAQEEADRRQKVLDKAKMMQYHNQDSVRAFHSKIQLYQTLKERDLQLKMKAANRPQNIKEQKRKEFLECQDIAQQQIKADAYKAAEARVKRLAYAREQMLQMKEKLLKEQEERNALLQEQMEYVRKDEEHRQEMAQKEKKKRAESASLQRELVEMSKSKIDRAQAIKQQDEALEERCQAWSARKSRQYELKKVIEKEWFNEALAKREQIGLVQAQLSNDLESKLEEKVQKAILLKDQQAALDEQKKLEKKAFRREELKLYYNDYIEREEERKSAIQKEEKLLLEQYMKIKEEADKEKADRKVQLLCTGKAFQEHHKAQVAKIQKETEKQKADRLEYDRIQAENMAKEDNELKEYMKSVADAPWASDNPRLKKYIKDTLERPKTARKSKEPPNTKERLGFLPGRYRRPELARMNPVVTGGYLKAIGKDTDHYAMVTTTIP